MHLVDESLNCQSNLLQFDTQQTGSACVLAWVSRQKSNCDLLHFSQGFWVVISPPMAPSWLLELRHLHGNNG